MAALVGVACSQMPQGWSGHTVVEITGEVSGEAKLDSSTPASRDWRCLSGKQLLSGKCFLLPCGPAARAEACEPLPRVATDSLQHCQLPNLALLLPAALDQAQCHAGNGCSSAASDARTEDKPWFCCCCPGSSIRAWTYQHVILLLHSMQSTSGAGWLAVDTVSWDSRPVTTPGHKDGHATHRRSM